ncbi:MAG: polymerase [Arcticibacter sp.]
MRLIRKILSHDSDTSRKTSIIALPAAAYSQETGVEFGALSIISFYTDKADTSTRSSTINGIVTFTTKKQSNFVIKPDIWTSGNKYHIAGTLRYKKFPFDFYGTGNTTNLADKDPIEQRLIVLNTEAERKITRGFYAGFNLGFENYEYRDKTNGGIFETGGFNLTRSGKVIYLGASVILDTRNTNTYTTRGNYLRLNYSYAPDFFGAENFTGSLVKADFRNFNRLSEKLVLGFQSTFQGLYGSKLPFYLLPQLGNDQIMRGYYTGRYRDQNLITAHAELRYRFVKRFAVTAFGGTGTVFRNGSFGVDDLKPNYGAGVRYFADPGRGLTLRMDYAVGEQRRGEPRQTGFYLALAEAF